MRRGLHILLMVACLLPAAAWSQTKKAPQGFAEERRLPKKLAILPLLDYSGDSSKLFTPELRNPLKVEAAKLLERFLGELEQSGPVVVVRAGELRKALVTRKGYHETMELARERYSLGRESFLALKQKGAVRQFKRAEELLAGVFAELSEPELNASVLETAGVAYTEMGLYGEAHMAFRRLFEIVSDKRFAPGYYPEAVNSALVAAYLDVRESQASSQALHLVAYPKEFLKALGGGAVLMPMLLKRGERPVLSLSVFSGDLASVEWVAEVPVDASGPSAVERQASRFLACTEFSVQKEEKQPSRKHLVSAAYTHRMFLRNPTRQIIHAPGVSAEYDYRLSPLLHLQVRGEVVSSIPDSKYQDLLHGFTGSQVSSGVLFSWNGRRWQIYGGTAFVLQILGTFETTRDPDCKFLSPDSPAYSERCPSSSLHRWPSELSFGAEVRTGVRFFLSERFFLDGGASFNLMVFPFNRLIEMNFPIAGNLGVGTSI